MKLTEATRGLADILAPGATLERVATGFEFTEGPIWHPHEHYLLFSDIASSRQYRWREGASSELFRVPSNQANGNAFDRVGRVVSCEHASSTLVRHEHDGKQIVSLASHFEGRALNSPNDVIVDSLGRIWFTDPTFGRTRADLGRLREPELPVRAVYRLDPDGCLYQVATSFDQPNGLCLSLDERRLFVNDTVSKHIWCFDVSASGELVDRRSWARVTGHGEGVPDGLKISLDGHLLCNGPGGVHVYNADAIWLGVIATPEKSTNFTFGGPQRNELFITASTSVYRIALAISGPPAFD